MTKKEITDKLDAYGVQYDATAHVKTLEKMLKEHENNGQDDSVASVADDSIATESPRVEQDMPEPKPRGTGSRYRASLGLRFEDRTESHNFYLTLEEIAALETYARSAKQEAGQVAFTLVYRNEKPVSKITGFVSEEQAALLAAYVQVGTL